MTEIGQRIKKIRKELKLSQISLADSLGIDRSHISKLEKGASEPSEMLVRHIANSYEVHLEWLKDGVGPMWLSPESTLEEIIKLKTVKKIKQIIKRIHGLVHEMNLECEIDSKTVDTFDLKTETLKKSWVEIKIKLIGLDDEKQ